MTKKKSATETGLPLLRRQLAAFEEIVAEEHARKREQALEEARAESEKFRRLETEFLAEAGDTFARLVEAIRGHIQVTNNLDAFWSTSGLPGEPPHVLGNRVRNVEEAVCGLYLAAFRRDSGNSGAWLAQFVTDLGDDSAGDRRLLIETHSSAGSNVGRFV